MIILGFQANFVIELKLHVEDIFFLFQCLVQVWTLFVHQWANSVLPSIYWFQMVVLIFFTHFLIIDY